MPGNELPPGLKHWNLLRDRIRAPLVHTADALGAEYPTLVAYTQVASHDGHNQIRADIILSEPGAEEDIANVHFALMFAPAAEETNLVRGVEGVFEAYPDPLPGVPTVQLYAILDFDGPLIGPDADVEMPREYFPLTMDWREVRDAVLGYAEQFNALLEQVPRLIRERMREAGYTPPAAPSGSGG